jgi:hypothetical protein
MDRVNAGLLERTAVQHSALTIRNAYAIRRDRLSNPYGHRLHVQAGHQPVEAKMERFVPPVRSLALHGAGVAVLGLAWISGRALEAIGFGHAGHEPASVYLLALVTFLLASSGTALATMGPRLFRKVVVADRWLPHVPAAFRERDRNEDQP